MINSPLNYSGNKYKALKDILPLLPTDVDHVVEVFSGSALVSLNMNAKNLYLNDISIPLLQLLHYFYENDGEKIIQDMEQIILDYGFTDTYRYGLRSYPEKKHEGLSKFNKDPYQKLKEDYNVAPRVELLFALIIYGFNHYMRFNRNGLFNVPVGKVDFSTSLRNKTIQYADAFKKKNVHFSNLDFRDPKLYQYPGRVFYYFDPPYLITDAPDNAYWSEEDEKDLLSILDDLNARGVFFALSNVVKSNGKENLILIEWAKKYHVHYLNRQYRNANYRRKNITEAIEVLITNY